MKDLFTGILAIIFSLSAAAQKSPMKFGDIPMEDMTMKTYPQDSSAVAVVLADYGEAYIMATSVDTKMTFERHIRIKILKAEGTRWADAVIPLFKAGSAEENVTSLKAVTYNLENGKIVESKLSKDAIFKEKFNRNFIHEKFTMPDVKPGSVLEYAYKISSDFLANFPNWEFQRSIPTRLSEYWAIIPDFLTFEKYMQGYVPVSSYEVKPMNVSGFTANGHHYISRNVPAFKAEPQMTSETDYLSKINFALSQISIPGQIVQDIMGSWPKLNSLLLEDEDFGGAIKGSGFLKSIVETVTKGITDPLDKITAIHNYVKQTIEWDGFKDFYAGNLKKVLEEKKGTSGDINLMLASMLRKAGLTVDMVLLSTRDNGFVREQYPMARQFNYVVCLVRLGDKNLFLDGTEKYLPVNVLPERCLNGRGLVISDKNFGWVNLDTQTKSKTIVNAEFRLDESGQLKGKIAFTHDGYDAHRMRTTFAKKGQEEYIKDFVGARPWKLDNTDFKNIDEIYNPAEESYELEIADHSMVAGDNIYFNPFVTSQIQTNPYKSETRVYPVDYGSKVERIYLCKVIAPDGYVVEQAPESRIMMLPGNAARFIYNVAMSPLGDWVSITTNFQINKNLFTQNDYLDLREFYNQVVAKQAEQIVFKKKI
jgi:hypothetical protein